MKIADVFGQLLLSVSGKLLRLSNYLGARATGGVSTTVSKPKTLLWGVIEGPLHKRDFSDTEDEYYGLDGLGNYMLVVQLEEAGEIRLVNFWYDTLDEAYAIKTYFDHHIEPLELEDE